MGLAWAWARDLNNFPASGFAWETLGVCGFGAILGRSVVGQHWVCLGKLGWIWEALGMFGEHWGNALGQFGEYWVCLGGG